MNLSEDVTGLTAIYSCVFIVGLPANLLSLWGLFQLLRSSNVLPIFILNLLLSDLIQLMTLPLWVIYLQKQHKWGHGEVLCNIVGFIFYVNLYASVVFMCLVAIDRYVGIVHPLTCQRFRTAKSAIAASFGVWLVTFLYCLFGLLPSVFYEDSMCMEVYPVGLRYAVFKIGTIVLGFLLPCFILGFTAIRIRSALRASPSVTQDERRKIVGILCTITVIFVGVFGPYHLVGAYKFVAFFITSDTCKLEKALFLCYRFCYGLTSFNNILDPLFYIFICDDIRKQLRRSLHCQGRVWGSEMSTCL
ncbi:GPR4 protein, partial [Polyodon spathula]|nr:GPR4 protein [Polyodon spathula]